MTADAPAACLSPAADREDSLRAAACPEWVPLADVYAAFCGSQCSLQSGARAARRWAASLNSALRRRAGVRALVRKNARLPDGVSVEAFVRSRAAVATAPQVLTTQPVRLASARSCDVQRAMDTQALLRAWRQFLAAHRDLPAHLDSTAARFADSRCADYDGVFSERADASVSAWAAAGNLSLHARSLRRYAARAGKDGNVDRRGRRPAGPSIPPQNEVVTAAGEVVDAAWDFFKALWLDQRKRTLRVCWEITAHRAGECGWSWLSYSQLRRRVARNLPDSVAGYFRLGPRRWERAHLPRMQRDFGALLVNQVWCGDHHVFDVVCGDESGRTFRPALTGWQDVRSRYIVGWAIAEVPSSDSILSALRDAIRAHGAPASLLIDNGKDYRSHALDELCARLSIACRFAEAYQPQAKPIESWHRTLCDRFSRLQPTYCGGTPEARPQELYERIAAGRAQPLALDELRRRFGAWLAEFHARPHSGQGMDGQSPGVVFASAPATPKVTAPAEVLERLLRREVRATVTRRGVRCDNLRYEHLSLFARQGRQVLLRVDDAQRERVEVCELDGAHVCWAENVRLTGADSEAIRAGKRAQARARRLARLAGPALLDSHRSVEDHARRAVQARRAAEVAPLAATGTDHAAAAAPRNLRLLPGASAALPPPPEPTSRRVARLSAMPTFADADAPFASPAQMPTFVEECEEPVAFDTPADRLARLRLDDAS